MNHPSDHEYARLPNDQKLLIDRLCSRFEAALKAGSRPKAEAVLKKLPAAMRLAALGELLPLEADYRQREGNPLTLPELEQRFPDVDAAWLADCVRAEATETEFGSHVQVEPEVPLPDCLGDYRIVGRLGSGGMGTVYRGVHERMGREVAVKLLRPEIQRNPLLLQRFDREVRAAAKLSHPNIVAALDAREHEGLHFLVTELVEGKDLDQTVRLSGPLPVVDAIECMLQVGKGLSYSHSQGVIHRDIKPANLLRANDGTVKILDMGLARLSNSESSNNVHLTESGVMMGTAAYMPPEQARDTRKADARSDLYSLGCTLFYLLTGRTAFSGTTQLDMILSHVNQPIPSLRMTNPQIPAALDKIFQRLVAKNPDDRFQTAEELLPELQSVLAECHNPQAQQTLADHLQARRFAPQTSITGGVSGVTGSGTTPAPMSQSDFNFPTQASPLQPAIDPQRIGSSSTSRTSASKTGRIMLASGTALVALLIVMSFVFFSNDDKNVLINNESGQSKGSEQGSTEASLKNNVRADQTERATSDDSLSTAGMLSLRFNGQSSYAVASGLQPLAGATYTLEAKVRPAAFRTSNIISWLGPDWMALFIGPDGTPGLARKTSTASFVYASNQPLELGHWYHIAASFTATEMRLFVNGQTSVLNRQNFELPETNGGFFIGGVDRQLLPTDQNDRFFDGLIESVRVSSGQRYAASSEPPLQLIADEQTLAAFPLQSAEENTSTVLQDLQGHYPLQLHETEWIHVSGARN